jgi:site-specific DNA-cytosine methylase
MPKYKPLYSLYKGLKENKYDVPDSYASFQKTLTQAGDAGAKSRRGLYQSLKDSNYDVPDTYEDFYKNLFVPVNSTTSRALKIGENPNTPTVNRYRQKMFDSVDPNKNGLNALSHRAVGQAVRATNNVRKPVTAKVVNQKGKPTGEEFAITPAKTVEDLDREYAQAVSKNWENELHDQMADADKDAAKISDMFKSFIGSTDEVGSVWGNMTRGGGIAGTPHSVTTNNGILENTEARQLLAAGDYNRKRRELLQLEQDSRLSKDTSFLGGVKEAYNDIKNGEFSKAGKDLVYGAGFDDHSFWRGMYDAAKDTGFLTGGASDLINAGSLLATKQDLDNGVHTEAGDLLMQQAVKNSNAQSQYGDNQGWMYTGGVITTNMAPFMVQIGSAGFSKGMSTSIGKVVQGAASKVALGTMEKATGIAGAHIANYIGKVTGLTTKAFGKAIQYGIVGAAQANTVGLGNVANDVINRYTGQVYQDEHGNYKFGTFDSDGKLVHEGGEDFLTALVKGEAAQTIEFATELAGGGIDAVGTALKNFVTKGGKKIINKYNMENVSKVIDFLLNNKVSKNARYLKAGADRTLGKVEVNSIVGESLEEELGIIANTVFTGDNKISDLWDEKQQSQIWGGMLLSIGLMKGAVAPFHAYNAKQYYSYKHKLDKADVNLSQLLGNEKWEELRNQIDATTNEDMPEMVNKINRDVALGKNRQPVREYIQNLLIMRGYDIGNMLAAKKAVEDKGEGVSVKNMEKNQAYQQGRDAYGYDTHEIQLDQEDKQKSLAQLLGISEQQLASMSDEELEALSGRDDNIDRAIYDYQLSTARYEGVIDNARDQIDLEVQRAAQAVDMYTDKSRNTIRNATIKATGGLEDYGVYIINGNIATHEDGSIDISNSDDMILYYDPTTNTVEHADAMMFAELGSEENADEVRSQAMADAKEKAIKETTGIIDGVVEVGTQFKTVDADGTEHTYEVLADNGDGTAMITIDGNIPIELVKGENVNVPVSFEELQKMKDESDQQRLQAAKAQREQMEKERAEQQMQAQTTQAENPAQEDNIQSASIEDNLDYSDIIREDGKVQKVDVSDKDGNNLFPDAKDVFYIQGNKMRTKFAYIDANGELKTQNFPPGLVKIKTRGEVSVDDYKKYRNMILSAESSAMPETSMIEDNSGENRGEIEVETPTIEGEPAAPESAETPATEQTPAAPAMTLEDGTEVPMLDDGNPDFSKLTAEQTAELYDSQFGEDADSIVSGYVSDAKKALDKANSMTVKGKTFVEQKAAKQAKEKAIADAQAAYDSAIAIRDAYNERQLAKVEDTAEGRKELIEKARRKFARLKSAVKDDAEAVAQIYKETVGTLLHRLYDGTGIDVTDTIPLTAEEYVASNLGAHTLNYEGTETSKGVKQETGLSREDFAKTQLLAADGKGTTVDNLVHSLWENRPSNLESLDTQEIRNTLIDVLTSGFKASEARNYIENLRIAQAENILEEQKKAAENAAYAEEQKAKQEEEKAEEKTHSEAFNKIVDLAKKQEEILDNPDNVKEFDKINREIDELLKTLSDEEFKEVSDALLNIDEDFEYLTADEYERREGVEESKKANAYNESLQQTIKQIAPYSDALKAAVKSGDKKAIAKAQKELTDALLASTLGHGYLSSQLAQAKMAKKKDETYSENRAFIKPLTDAINAIESALDSAIADAGLEGVHVDFKDNGHGWIYADKGSEWSSRLKPLDNNYRNVSQYDGVNPASVLPQITMDNVEKVAGIIKSRIEEGERYNSDEYNDEENEKINDNINENINSPEQTKFPDKLREGSDTIEVPEDATDDKPLGKQLSKDKVPFKVEGKNSGEMYDINDNEDRQRLINDNKVDDKDILDIDMPEHVHKAIKELCKKMGLKVQFLYMGANLNGWVENGTMYLALDAKNAIQCVFGHEMTHAIKQKNPEAYKELVKVALAVTTKKEFEEDLAKVYQSYHGYKGYNNVDDFVEEVVADNIGKFINDYDLAKKFSLRLSHPVLATILHAIQKIKSLLYGDFYKSVDALERIVEKAYVDTAKGEITNSETGEDVSFSLRQKPEPKKKGIGYKVFVLKDGKLYPPMVANPNGAATPVGVWLDADAAPIAGESKTGRPQVKQGGKGTQGGSGKLAYRPGWHLGVVPYAIQFNRKDAEGNKTLFPKNFVFAEVEYAADVDYQEEARQEGINPSGKYQHSLAGLKHLPTDGYYMYRTNPNPETDPWVITGAMKVNRILTRAEQAELVKNAGREPQQIQEGDIVTDDVVDSINQEIADAPKFSIKTYHGSQASFDKFDHSFMGSGEGAQAYGWGTYVSEVEGIAKAYAKANAKKNAPSRLMYQGKPMTYKTPSIIYQVALDMDKFNISAKEAISKMIDADEKKLASVGDTPFAKMKAKQVQDELKVLKDLNPSDFKINEDYDTVAQDLIDTKSGLDLLEDELKDAKSYVDLYQSRLDEAKEELSKAKESGTGLGVDMYESDVEYYSEQVKRYKQSIKTKESDIKDVKNKVDALQKKLDSMEKPRNLYSVDIPDDTGDNYLGWDEPLNAKQIDMWKKALLSAVPESDRAYYKEWADGMLENRKKENNPLTGKDAYYAIDSKYASKKTSMALSKAGFVGVKVIAQRNTGGNKEGKMNYVIFDENNAQITSHTKFSLKKDGLTPEIANTPVNIVDADEEHGFKNYAEAREWAKKNIVRTYNDEETGGKGEINISNTAVGKYLSEKAIDKSISKDVHMSVLKVLPSVLRESVDAYQHGDRKKVNNVRSEKFGINPDVMIHRCFGAVNIGGKVYGVKITLKENVKTRENKKLYSYEATKIELLDGKNEGVTMTPSLNSNNSITVAKIAKVFETAKKNGEKFSLKDEKTLAGVHNITEEKLRKALKLGGFANPSLAVIDTNKTGHDNFGEISFIAPSALLDKRTGNTGGTWITDAYTQRYPSIEREMSEKGSQKFKDWVDSLEYPSEAKAEIKRQAEDALSNNNAPAWELMYLKEKGIDIKEYDSRIDYRWKEIISDHPTAEDILNSMKTDPELNEKVTSLAKHAIIHPTWEKVSLEVRRKMYKETGVKASPINPQVRKQTKEIFERDYAPTLLNKDGSPRKKDVKKVVEDIVKEHNDTKKYDFYLSKVKASNYVNKNGLYDDYIRWQENKLDEFGTKNRIFRGYTKDGSRKYVPETLENVSKAMREEADGQTNGSEYTSFGSFIAKLASRVDSTDEMRANKDKLSSNKDKEEFYEKWNGVYYDLAKFLYNDVFYGEQRLHDIVLQSDPKKYAKKEYGITLTPTFMKKLDALKNAVQTELKSAYFETKYNRPLRLNEFAAAVVPNNLGDDVRKGISDAGLPMYDYDPKKDGDRSRAFNEAINSSDNIRFSLKDEKEKIVADAKANGTYMIAPNGEKTKLDAEQWATVRTTNFKNWFGDWENDPENASKVVDENGEPLVAYHGTTNDETTSVWNEKTKMYDTSHEPFTVFKREVDGLPNSGLFFNSSEDNAYEYGYNNYAVYLSAKNPLVIDCKGSLYNSIKHDGKTMDTYDWANWAEENGYDGVIFKNIKDGVDYGSMQDTTDDYVVFKSNQIKSAENNNGDFSADNNDIRFSLKSMMAKPEGWKQANKKAIHIAEAIERDPKFSLKNLDGTLIKAGTYFSGGGLVEEGLKGIIDPVVAVEYDEKISGVYRNNFGQHIVTADVRDVDPKDLVKQIDGEVEYFHASPVCKNYSQAKNNHAEVELDKETAASTAEFINAVKPKVVTIENVKGYKDSDAMKTITDALDANGYTWDADVYNAADFGGYTNRERLIVRAVRDGKLPAKPKKMEHKSGWYEAVADIIPTLTEKKNGVANWMDVRLKADGIDWRNIDKPLYVMGSAYADGKIPHAFADELLPTLRTKSGDVIVMPDGKVYRAMGRVLARVSGVSDDYKMPFSESLSHTIIGNGIPTQLTEHVIAPLVQNTLRPTPEDGNTKFSLRGSTPYDKQMEEWMEKNHLEKGAVPMEKPIMKEGENIFDYANRMVEWTRNQNLWKTAPKQTGFQDALDKWKADNGLSPDAYPPVRPHREYYSSEIGYSEDLEEYNKKKVLWKSAPKPKDFDLSVDLEDMNKQLRNIRRAVLNQKNYDQRTVKAVSDLVRKMLNIGWGDGLSRGKVGNLLSAAKNATGANDVKKYLDKAMGILAENYLNRLSTAYDNLINTKGARADQSGVIKMGSLDAKGQAFMSEYKKAINMDDKSLNNYIANIEEDSAKNEDNVEMNDYRLAGIQAAIMYKQQIGGNDADISELKRQIDELKNKKDATKEDKDLLKSLEKKLFENKFDRITMYENLLNNIQRMVKESKGRAKEFREEIAEHKNEILYRANLDLEGVDSTYYDTTTAKKKLVNNDLQRAVFSSTYTFEQFLKFFGKKAANGEGRLYNYFTKLNQDALDEEQLYNEMNRNALDEKTKELFGKNKFMNLVGIDGKDMKEMDVEVTDYSNKETGKRTIHLKQGQMLYIYLVNKETDGEMKLRAMGITEEDVAAIEENLDPRVKAMGEWLQDEYLPECQRRYQATHTKYFGAPMKEVENYFPLAINNRARNVKEDVNQDSDAISQLAGTSTGAIVTRRVNVIPLDIENADAFEVAFNHLQEMEEWSAMLPFRQDINTLLSYTHFRNQVQNMSSVAYGSGKTLWDEFKQTAQIAAGTYKPKVNAGMMDSRIAAAMGGIAVAKISGRLWTAIKQSQSATVFLPECDFTRFVKNGVNPYGSWKWAMENIPDFRKRVENMTYGDVKLRQYLDELEKWHDWTKTISKIGMAPNILVDGITCAVGARSVYETEVNRLTKLGYPKEKAEEKAYYKAVAAYNKTQQSSGGMYLSPMQVDRTYVSAALSLFKNANYAYGRMQIEACRGLARTYDFWGGKHKTTLIESMTRQIMEEDGLDENTARAIAKATYNRTFRQSIGRLINFATLVPVSWALYKVLPYLLTGDDDDKKNDMIEEAVLKGFATSLSDNYVIPFASNILNAGLKVEDGKPTFDPEVFRYQNLYINPATSDLANIYSMVGNQKWYSVANKLGMLGVQSLIGFNPETVGALYQAFAEADYDNGNTAKEWQIGILKAISAPEESIRELYMDELGLKSGDIKKIPLAELEKRYAERQINRDNLLSQIGMDAETFNGYVDKYQKSFEKKIKDKMDKWDEYNKKKADEFFDTTSDPKLKDMIEKKRAKDANAAADEQIAKEGLNQEKKGKEPSEEAYDAVKMSIDVAEDNAISTYNKVLNKRYAALNDEYNNQTDAMKYIFMSKHPNFKAYKDLESEYTTYGKKMKELKEKLVSADGYDAKQTILKQIRAEREKFSELQSKVR